MPLGAKPVEASHGGSLSLDLDECGVGYCAHAAKRGPLTRSDPHRGRIVDPVVGMNNKRLDERITQRERSRKCLDVLYELLEPSHQTQWSTVVVGEVGLPQDLEPKRIRLRDLEPRRCRRPLLVGDRFDELRVREEWLRPGVD